MDPNDIIKNITIKLAIKTKTSTFLNKKIIFKKSRKTAHRERRKKVSTS